MMDACSTNLSDLHNYLVTFNKDIEVSDPLTASDQEVSESINDFLSSVSASSTLPDSSSGHFGSGLYTEQSLLESDLGDVSTANIHSLVTGVDNIDNDIAACVRQECQGIDLDDASISAVQAHLANLTGSITDLTSQDYIMATSNDSLDSMEGKVIKIVSLDQDGGILSLVDGNHMQVVGGDMLHSNAIQDSSPMDQLLGMSSSGQCFPYSSAAQSTVFTMSSGDLLNTDTMTSDSQVLCAVLSSENAEHNTQVKDALSDCLSGIEPAMSVITPEMLRALCAQNESGLNNSSGSHVVVDSDSASLPSLAVVSAECTNGDIGYILVVGGADGSVRQVGLDSHFIEQCVAPSDGEVRHILRLSSEALGEVEPGLSCSHCSYTSSKRYLLTRHMKSHCEDRPYLCDVCHRGFKTYASLNNHVNTHSGIRPFKCKDCESAFTTSGELVRHVRYRHTFEKPHKCSQCDYASVELSKLKRHMRSHTGERPYQCSVCSYASPDTYKLKRHMRIHTGEKPYVCEVCNARFTQSNSLKAHRLIHTGNKPVFHCSYCPATCGRKTDLKIHMQKLHYGDKQLVCCKCNDTFTDRYGFKMHWKSHIGEKCYKCEDCEVTFQQKGSLQEHRKHVHLIDRPADEVYDSDKGCDITGDDGGTMSEHGVHLTDVHRLPATSSDGEISHQASATDHLVHMDLMQDWRDGKLGNAPQVVIVHPNGRIEEVTPSLEIFQDLSSENPLSEHHALSHIRNSLSSSTAIHSGLKGRTSVTTSSSAATTTPLRSPVSQVDDVVKVKNRVPFTDALGQTVVDDGWQREAGTQVELLSSSSCDEVGFDGDVRNMRDDRAARMKSFLKSDNGATGSSSDSETGLCSRAMESDLENVVSFHNLVAILGPDADHPLPVSSHDCDIVLVDDTSIPAGHWLTSPQQQVTVTASTSSTTIVQANHTAASPGMFPSSRKHPDDRSVPASEEDLFEHLNSFCYSSHPEWSKIIEPQSSAVGGQTPSVSGDTDCSALPEVTHSSLCPQESFSSSRCSLSGGNREVKRSHDGDGVVVRSKCTKRENCEQQYTYI